MRLTKSTRMGLVILLLALSLAACGPAEAPQPTPEPTEAVTATPAATITLMPTKTEAPTFTPVVTETPAGAGNATAVPPAGSDVNAGNTTGNAAGTGTGAGTGAGTGTGTGAGAAQPPAAGKAADQYTYVSQSVPDKSQFLPGRTVTITWTVKNSGTVAWVKDYTFVYFSGPHASKDIYTFGKDVPPGKTLDITITFTTPQQPGDYDMWYKLRNNQSQNFGDLDLVYTVSNSPSNKAPAPTATPTK